VAAELDRDYYLSPCLRAERKKKKKEGVIRADTTSTVSFSPLSFSRYCSERTVKGGRLCGKKKKKKGGRNPRRGRHGAGDRRVCRRVCRPPVERGKGGRQGKRKKKGRGGESEESPYRQE